MLPSAPPRVHLLSTNIWIMPCNIPTPTKVRVRYEGPNDRARDRSGEQRSSKGWHCKASFSLIPNVRQRATHDGDWGRAEEPLQKSEYQDGLQVRGNGNLDHLSLMIDLIG